MKNRCKTVVNSVSESSLLLKSMLCNSTKLEFVFKKKEYKVDAVCVSKLKVN